MVGAIFAKSQRLSTHSRICHRIWKMRALVTRDRSDESNSSRGPVVDFDLEVRQAGAGLVRLVLRLHRFGIEELLDFPAGFLAAKDQHTRLRTFFTLTKIFQLDRYCSLSPSIDSRFLQMVKQRPAKQFIQVVKPVLDGIGYWPLENL